MLTHRYFGCSPETGLPHSVHRSVPVPWIGMLRPQIMQCAFRRAVTCGISGQPHGMFRSNHHAGNRNNNNGALNNEGSNGSYWSSTPNSNNSYNLNFNSSNANMNNNNRANGFSMLCVRELTIACFFSKHTCKPTYLHNNRMSSFYKICLKHTM